MFNAVYDLEAGKTEDINQTIRLKTDLLVKQLTALELQNGNTKYVTQLLQHSATT